MRYIFAIITLLAINSCRQNEYNEQIEIVFSPGFVEYNLVNKKMFNKIKPDTIMEIMPNDYSFLKDELYSPNKKTSSIPKSPCILMKLDTIIYTIGGNRVVEVYNKTYSISEYDNYRMKCIFHFYDFFEYDDLCYIEEVNKFGIPANYKHVRTDHNKPPKPYVKIVLKQSSM